MDRKFYLFFDLETTGLAPHAHSIIEAAYLITNQSWRVYEEHTSLIRPTGDPHWSAEAMRMHHESGLLDEWLASGTATKPISYLDHMWRNVETHIADEDDVYLAGQSVHFDRAFHEELLPVPDYVSHRHLDARTVIEVMGDEVVEGIDVDGKPHRALHDVHRSLRLFERLDDMTA